MQQKYYLGINSSHDAGACLFRGNTLVVAIEEERLNKDKHSVCRQVANKGMLVRTLPYLSISYVLQEAGIALDELEQIYVNDCDLMGHYTIKDAEEGLRRLLPVKDKKKIVFIPPSSHHLMHAYNAHYLSPFKESVILIIDAYVSGDEEKKRAFETIYYAKDNKIEEIYSRLSEKGEMGIGAFFQFFCKLMNFDSKLEGEISNNYFGIGHDEAGKLMALASYGRPYFTDKIVKKKNGFLSIQIKDLYKFASKYNLVRELIDPKNLDTIEMKTSQRLLMPARVLSDYRDKFVQNLAYFAQRQLEEAIFILIETADKLRQSSNLCISGGVALNCLANGKIKERYKSKSIYIPFAPADNGNAIGVCFYAYAKKNNNAAKKFVFRNLSPFLGKKYSIGWQDIILAAKKAGLSIKEENFFFEKLSKDELAKKIAEFLYNDMVIAFITEGSEFGPRALGHRSILANPFSEATKDYVNQTIKKREWFRPFAPAVLSSHKDVYFKTLGIENSNMTFTVALRTKFSYLSAIKNKDNTSRIQIVNSEENSLFAKVIKEFGKMSGAYLLLNTSCNIKRYPIIEHPLEVFYLYKQMPVDAVVIDDMLIIPRYDIFREFTRYKEDKLNEASKEKLADSFFGINNYYRAQYIHKEIFKITKSFSHLLKVFKSLLFLPETSELQHIFYQLKTKRRLFLRGVYNKNICNEYRIYMGLYEICYGKNKGDLFGLNELIISEQDKRKKKAVVDKCIQTIFFLSALIGEEKLLLKLQKSKNQTTRDFFRLLLKEHPDALNSLFFQKSMRQ
ncbi:MAG: carbamoyltransferase C-terminal domain-containing protein [Candidatus Omnitrophica bacterium]|nr:carbamoyltransferase C-terminal domain-containing protein [Candidatus Omnitrophota bacterium]